MTLNERAGPRARIAQLIVLFLGCLVAGCGRKNDPKAWYEQPAHKVIDFPYVGIDPTVSSDEKWVAVNQRNREREDGTIALYQMPDLVPGPHFKTDRVPKHLAFAGEKYLISAHPLQGMFTELTVWDVATKDSAKTYRLGSVVESMAASPSGKFVAVGTNGNAIRLFEVPSLEIRGETLGFVQANRIFGLAFSSDGKTLFVSDESRSLQTYQVDERGNLLPDKSLPKAGRFVAISADAQKLATGPTHEGDVLILDGKSFEVRQRLKSSAILSARNIAFSVDGNELIVGNSIFRAEAAEFKPVEIEKTPSNSNTKLPHVGFGSSHSGIAGVTYFPSGKWVLSVTESGSSEPGPFGPISQGSASIRLYKRK